MTRKRVVHHPGAAWVAAVAGAWLVAAACRTMQGAVASAPAPTAVAALEGPAASVAEPVIRVGIRVAVEAASVGAPGGVVVRGRAPGEAGAIVRTLPRATFRPAEPGRVLLVETGDRLELATAWPAAAGELVRVDDAAYRGVLEVRPAEEGTLTVVNSANLEDYLRGVVPNELSPQAFPHLEALKAQAVAARTYALAHLRDYASKGFDVCATPSCQVYRGQESEHPLADRAVRETAGVVATWRGRPINAYYTSTCGGHTEDGGAIFDDAAPYLKGVACQPERASRHYRWEVRLRPEDVARTLARYGRVGQVRDIVPKRLGVSGRVVELGVVGSEGELALKGLKVRWGLGLRENLFVVERERDARGNVRRFVITGKGWGHGVGLCQVGSFGMAQAGSTFEEILGHYYAGVTVSPRSPRPLL